MSAIANISAALGYDAIESALVTGSFADACNAAALMYASAPIGDETAPESARTVFALLTSTETATVRPAKYAA